MANHYEVLRRSGRFPNVPVRVDHSISVASVVGYFSGVYADEKFLYADIELTEPEAIEKYERGTFRSVSLELGPYETNDQDLYWPVARGLAFVDVPAAEGLFRQAGEMPTIILEETEVSETELHTFSVRGVPTTDYAAVAAYISELETVSAPEVHTFRVNGSDVADYETVQAHIESLETFRAETIDNGRVAFVDSLIESNRLAASAKEATIAFAKSLNAEQFDAYVASFEAAPAIPTLERHAGSGDGNTDPNAGNGPSEIDVLRETVRMHRAAGMTEDVLAQTASFQRLQTLEASK